MLKNPGYITFISTLYAIIYVLVLQFERSSFLTLILFSLSPFIILWLAYTIIRYGSYQGKDLKQDEHWGYQDETEIYSSSANEF